MRKVMLLAAMLAMVLAAAAPALAQGDIGDVNQGDDQFNVGDETVYSAVCQNIIGSFQASAGQDAAAVADATAGDNAAAVAEIAQAQDVSVAQANECLNAWFASASPSTSPTPHATADGGGGGGGGSATALPATGGMVPSSALALGAGALLVGGGLLARRIVR
ncbi:MAG TPA: LPXTG cell wall anchor domain-containing protein [Rubrobacteraceae bacterium]|nr:LPXTG cell wall anchor domain-containing protein [Rubrobacteraceae bacterium]